MIKIITTFISWQVKIERYELFSVKVLFYLHGWCVLLYMFIAKIIELFEDAARNYRLQGSNLIKTLDLGVQYNYR
tara:strand:+ start:452 stop:676 length:225 start_codon:yes stop_codon:yes gene_type:complete